MCSLNRLCPLILALAIGLLPVTRAVATRVEEKPASGKAETHETRTISGWVVKINKKLLDKDRESTEKALTLLKGQLDEVRRVVPAEPLQALLKVTIWVSPEYPGVQPRAEYHPGPEWLRANGRDPAMAKGVEITCIRDYESECKRMPMWMLHELAHAYHYQVLGVNEPDIRAAYEKAKASRKYDKVERRFADGKTKMARAYAMTNAQEYFAECTEAFFGVNDWFPYTLPELQKHDPLVVEVLRKAWKVKPDKTDNKKPAAKPLKVFILAGQSNMQGHANVSTFDSMAEDPKTAPILKEMRDANGKPCVCEKVWISSVGCAGDGWKDVIEQKGKLTKGFGAGTDKIGPEFTFGISMEKRLGEPVLIIKTSWGGRSLHTDFRPPGAGPEMFNDFIIGQWKKRGLDVNEESAKINKNVGVFYRHMIDHVRKVLADIQRVVPDYDPSQGYELAGFVWFQGFNDMIDDWTYHDRMKPGGYDQYGDLLAQLIRDVRKDLSAPKMPFVIGVMGIDGVQEGKKAPQLYFRRAQAAPASLPEFQGNVVAVETAPFWDDDLAALHVREEKLNEKLDQEAKKGPKLTQAEKDAAHKKAIEENFTPEELKRLKGISNGGYHYLGAAKIMAPIGKAFAEAMPLTTAEEPKAPRPTTGRGTSPVKVFILAGQSNMEGQGLIKADPKRNQGKGSLEHLTKDSATADKFKHLLGKDGKWAVRDNVWIHYLDRKGKLTVGYGAKEDRIGPELGFGEVIGDAYQEPVLLIKLAWGGKSLAKDFRPPSSGGEVGPYYKEIVQRTKEVLGKLDKEFPELGDCKYELAGFGWHQGWNDRVNQAFNDEYEKNMANFIRDIRKDLGVKNLPFVIAETGMSGPEEKHTRALSLMKAQAAVAEYKEFQGNVAFVGTKTFWREKELSPSGQAYHWNTNAETYYLIGEAMGNAMKKLCAAKPPVR